jgi:hypothetical protein
MIECATREQYMSDAKNPKSQSQESSEPLREERRRESPVDADLFFEEIAESAAQEPHPRAANDEKSKTFSGADLRHANLSGAKLVDATLVGADLRRANLSDANLSGANLSGATLMTAKLGGARLHMADLSTADLTSADLSRANLYGVNLSGANLDAANLDGADLRSASSITSAIFRYPIARSILDTAYSGLATIDAVRARGIARLLPTLFGLGWLLTELFRMGKPILSDLSTLLVHPALAAAPNAQNLPFVPPLGLPQMLFNILVFAFAFVMLLVILGLLWSGYLAPKKNAKAAALVEHFGTFLLGAFFGTRLSPL